MTRTMKTYTSGNYSIGSAKTDNNATHKKRSASIVSVRIPEKENEQRVKRINAKLRGILVSDISSSN